MKDIILVGYGDHGRNVADTIVRGGEYHIVGYTDIQKYDDAEYLYLGPDESLVDIYKDGITYAVLGVGYSGKSELRDWLTAGIRKIGFELPTIIDPTAMVSDKVEIGEGTYIGKNVVIGTEVIIGKMCILSRNSAVDPKVWIGDYSHISQDARVRGEAKLSDHCFVGPDSIVRNHISIGSNAIVGPGATVIKDIGPGESYYGIA